MSGFRDRTKGPEARPAEQTISKTRPAYFYRLSPRDQKRYLASEQVTKLPFAPNSEVRIKARAVREALESENTFRAARACQALVDELCRSFNVPSIVVEVRGVRPHNRRGELHGLFYSSSQGGKGRIILWSRTARRNDFVKPKTFFRTLIHEFVHHLDYSLLKLGASFHTEGFYKRESFLVRALWPPDGDLSHAKARTRTVST